MKRIAAILLLGIILFNLGGYRFVTNYFESQAEQNLQTQLDQDQYDDADLVLIKVPATLPYGSSSEKFERVDGNIEIEGIHYTYVKRRFYMDTLELMCIPNTARTSIRNARNDFFRLANDLIENTHSASKKTNTSHPHIAKFSVADFTDDHFFSWQFGCTQSLDVKQIGQFDNLGDDYIKAPEHPPEV